MRNLLLMGTLSHEQIATALNVPVETVLRLAQTLKTS